MKDLNYSLIDRVLTDIKVIKERTQLLRLIKRSLKKGTGTFETAIEFIGNLDYTNELGFTHECIGTFHYIIGTKEPVKNYKFTLIS